jgi:hypothetical protein
MSKLSVNLGERKDLFMDEENCLLVKGEISRCDNRFDDREEEFCGKRIDIGRHGDANCGEAG